MGKYLDKTGLQYFYNKLKEKFADKSTIENKLNSLTGALTWKGEFSSLPATTDYTAGNVIKVGTKEYVLTENNGTKSWDELGDEGSYLLKSTAEETYLKKAAAEVKTANLANGAVTSAKLSKGVRNTIVITKDTKTIPDGLLDQLSSQSHTVDAVFRGESSMASHWGDIYPLYNIANKSSAYELIFAQPLSLTRKSYMSGSPDTISYTCYKVNISGGSILIEGPYTDTLEDYMSRYLRLKGYPDKSTLTPVLQEIDLTGTDADRKAKLDKFETDWKALTGASDLTGARFVGYCDYEGGQGLVCIYFYNSSIDAYGSIGRTDSGVNVSIELINDGQLTITPLFQHLEAITIYTDNTPEHMQANRANIKAYEANLQALGVDTTKSPMIPCSFQNSSRGWITKSYTASGYEGHAYVGIARDENGAPFTYFIFIKPTGIYSKYDAINSRYINNNFELGVVGVQANAKSLEAVVIKTGNTPDDKAANVAAIKAYVDNLTALGVDTTKGYTIPIRTSDDIVGVIYPDNNNYRGFSRKNTYSYAITISQDGTWNRWFLLDNNNDYAVLNTINKKIFNAINEVNALAKSKQDALTSGTNIKTVNGQSLLGSGNITISGGGSAPVLVNIDDISGSIGSSVSVDVFNTIANAASTKTPIFGYSELVEGSTTTYEIIPLYVKNISTTSTSTARTLSIQFVRASAYNSVLINRRSDTECSILLSVSRAFALDTSVDKSSTKGVQSNAVWNEIHSEPMTVNTAISGVTTLSSADKHKILCYAASGTQQYNLPESPVDGETFLFLKVNSGHTITISSGTGNQDIYDCSSGNSSVSKTIASSTRSKITVTYSSTVGKWFLMADDFLS